MSSKLAARTGPLQAWGTRRGGQARYLSHAQGLKEIDNIVYDIINTYMILKEAFGRMMVSGQNMVARLVDASCIARDPACPNCHRLAHPPHRMEEL